MDDINTQGMTLLLEGNAEDAVQKLLMGYYQHCESLTVTQQDIDNDNNHNHTAGSFQVPSISLHNAVDVEMHYVCQGNEFRLFDCAFVVEGDIDPRGSPLGKVILSVVIMYNIGVIFHLLGAFPSDEENLAKAFFMYSKAAETLRRYKLDGSHSDELEMALYCNMGHVYSHMLDEKGMNLCRHEIKIRLEKADRACHMDPATLQFFRDTTGLHHGSFDRAPAA